ncbi:hypothetical protein C8J57DRAFT_1447506 [Mycena rebaudengoi]|nr:hypothetical protein C8J57DRAFT_1447506 [Mycena rebaudengoi]
MALNWTMLSPNRSPVPLPNESTITAVPEGVEMVLHVPDAPPDAYARAGGSGGSKTLKAIGKITVTDQRFIFTSASDPQFESLSVPLPSILSTKFEQPTFGSNYLTFEIRPSPDGGLTSGTTAEVRFKDRAMFEFVAALEKTRERAIYMKRQTDAESNDEGLPVYTSPAEGSSTSTSGVNTVPIDNPPGYDV